MENNCEMKGNEITDLFLEQLKSVVKFVLPQFELPSIGNNPKKPRIINFKNGEYYDSKTRIFHLNKNQTFEGDTFKGEKEYHLINGIYKWPSGQVYKGSLENNKNEGEIILGNGTKFKGKINNNLSGGEGIFKFKNDEYIDGIFDNWKIKGVATVKTNNFTLKGNYNDSILDGKVERFNARLNNHSYIFPIFNFINNSIQEEELKIIKDNIEITFINKIFEINNDTERKKRINISNYELDKLNQCFSLLNQLIPNIEFPSIQGRELINNNNNNTDDLNIKFTNGIEANFDEEKNEQIIEINGERFEGMLNDENSRKYWLDDGKYIWPSGQVYTGNFNKNNEFESKDAEIKKNNEWTFKGSFKKGKINGYGKFEWNNGNNYLDSYFKDGNIDGNTTIKWNDLNIKGVIGNALINEFEASFNGHTYKIQKIDKRFNGIIMVEKDQDNVFIIEYHIKNNIIEIFEYDQNEIESLLNMLKSKNNFHIDIEPFSFEENKFIVVNENNGEVYDEKNKILTLKNNETFEGLLTKCSSNNYKLNVGEYKWPSGQKYVGDFNEKNQFDKGTLTFANKLIYKGSFTNGVPNGKGQILWDDDNYIKANFENGKIVGKADIKKNNISFEANYNNSRINGPISSINIIKEKSNYLISNITINKEIIEEDFLEIQEKGNDNSKISFELKKENKILLNNNNNYEVDENEVLLIFKSLSHLKKLNLSSITSISISDKYLINKANNNLDESKKVHLTFPNNDTFVGKIEQKSGKIYLINGTYKFASGLEYKGDFIDNKFHSPESTLKYKEKWIYTGGFENGHFEGKGEFILEKSESVKGIFKNGEVEKDIIIRINDDYNFEGDHLYSIKDLYIKNYSHKIKEHNYEINDFRITDNIIKIKKDYIACDFPISNDYKIKIIESLIVKNSKLNKQKFYYYEPYKSEDYKEIKMKMLKIQDNINSKKLNKISIYCNTLSKKNKYIKGKIGDILGMNVEEELDPFSVNLRLKLKKKINKDDARILRLKIENYKLMDVAKKNENNEEIEENEILKLCDKKMIKEIENIIYLIEHDINTLKDEKEVFIKEKYNKTKELSDLIYYKDLFKTYYEELKSEKAERELVMQEMDKTLKNILEENKNLEKYLNNLKNNGLRSNTNKIDKKIKELENENERILNEIKKKENIINSGNKEKEELLNEIKKLESKIKG